MNVLNAASAVKKRIKNALTLAQKWEMIQFKKATQRSLCAKFGKNLKNQKNFTNLLILQFYGNISMVKWEIVEKNSYLGWHANRES